MDERELAVVTQTTVTLPFLDDEVPALYLADGRPYIPVFTVCHALGITPAWRYGLQPASCRSRPKNKASVWCGAC